MFDLIKLRNNKHNKNIFSFHFYDELKKRFKKGRKKDPLKQYIFNKNNYN